MPFKAWTAKSKSAHERLSSPFSPRARFHGDRDLIGICPGRQRTRPAPGPSDNPLANQAENPGGNQPEQRGALAKAMALPVIRP